MAFLFWKAYWCFAWRYVVINVKRSRSDWGGNLDKIPKITPKDNKWLRSSGKDCRLSVVSNVKKIKLLPLLNKYTLTEKGNEHLGKVCILKYSRSFSLLRGSFNKLDRNVIKNGGRCAATNLLFLMISRSTSTTMVLDVSNYRHRLENFIHFS